VQLKQGVDLKLTFEYEAAQFAQRRPERGSQKVVKWGTVKTKNKTKNNNKMSSSPLKRVKLTEFKPKNERNKLKWKRRKFRLG